MKQSQLEQFQNKAAFGYKIYGHKIIIPSKPHYIAEDTFSFCTLLKSNS